MYRQHGLRAVSDGATVGGIAGIETGTDHHQDLGSVEHDPGARQRREGTRNPCCSIGDSMTRDDLTRRLELLTERLMRQRLQLQEMQRVARETETACHQLEGAIGTVRELLDGMGEPVGPNGADPEIASG